jgi:DNA uptake protein ComE-like DNA-binding protein
MSLKRQFLIVVVLSLGLLTLAACGGSPTPTTAPRPTAEVTVNPSSAETATEEATVVVNEENEEDEAAEAAEVMTEESTSEATADTTAAVQTATCTKLNLNIVTADQLTSTIPDFSSRMVREFQEYRPYVSIQQFRREIGKYVDETQVTEWEQYVYVPVSPNDADAETLMQIDGVDETLANTLIDGRPYADNQAFLAALAGSLTADQLAQAACYLAPEA